MVKDRAELDASPRCCGAIPQVAVVCDEIYELPCCPAAQIHHSFLRRGLHLQHRVLW